jgi:hypothetical protein
MEVVRFGLIFNFRGNNCGFLQYLSSACPGGMAYALGDGLAFQKVLPAINLYRINPMIQLPGAIQFSLIPPATGSAS